MRKMFVMMLLTVVMFSANCNLCAEDIKIGFLVKLPEEQWFQGEWKYAQQCADTYGFELIKIGVIDSKKALSAIDSLAAQGAQGFVICTPDPYLGPKILASAHQYAMKVFTVDDRCIDLDGTFMNIPYMGFSHSHAGGSVGTELYKEFRKRAWPLDKTAALAVTFDELEAAKQTTDSAIETLMKLGFPEGAIYRAQEETTDIPGAFEAANRILLEHDDVERWLVFSFNDDGALGAIRALEFSGFNADTIIGIGIGTGAGFAEFQAASPTGYFASLFVTPYFHGYEATEYLYTWIKNGIQPPEETLTTGIFVNRKNYKDVIDELRIKE